MLRRAGGLRTGPTQQTSLFMLLRACLTVCLALLPIHASIPWLQAHIQAADALAEGGAQSAVAGKAYFVTNDDPRPFWGFMGDLCEGLGYGRPHIR